MTTDADRLTAARTVINRQDRHIEDTRARLAARFRMERRWTGALAALLLASVAAGITVGEPGWVTLGRWIAAVVTGGVWLDVRRQERDWRANR